jgi:hypothetical protein
MSNPEVYESLIQIDGEFNPGNENVSSLLQRIMDPLTNNAKADPEGWDFDPKGSIWSTMLGYNAMDKARARLGETEVLPGVSAAEVLAQSDDGSYSRPLGNNAVTLNAPMAGNLTREAAKANRGDDGDLSISERGTIISKFDDMLEEERNNLTASEYESPDKEAVAKRKAAARIMETYPEAAAMPEIRQWLSQSEEVEGTEPSTAPESPPTAPSAPVASEAPATSSSLPKRLPSGATMIKDNGDGTSDWKRPDGSVRTYDNNDVAKLVSGPIKQAKPTPGYLDRMGSEYD